MIEAWKSRPQRTGAAPAARAAEVAEVELVGGCGTAVTGGGAAVHMQGDGSKVPDRGLMGGGSTAQTGEVELVGGRGTAVTGGGAAAGRWLKGDG